MWFITSLVQVKIRTNQVLMSLLRFLAIIISEINRSYKNSCGLHERWFSVTRAWDTLPTLLFLHVPNKNTRTIHDVQWLAKMALRVLFISIKVAIHVEMPKAVPKKSSCHFQKLEMILKWNKQNTLRLPKSTNLYQ